MINIDMQQTDEIVKTTKETNTDIQTLNEMINIDIQQTNEIVKIVAEINKIKINIQL